MSTSTSGPGNFGGLAFRLVGFPVRVRSSFFLTTLLLAFAGGRQTPAEFGVWAAVVFASVLWHELGHALVARSFGLASEIELHAMGGVTRHRGSTAVSWGRQAIIALGGPVFGLVLGGVVWLIARASPAESVVGEELYRSVLWVNVGWSLLNLLPVLPYDGGIALRAGLGAITRGRGELAANVVSLLVGGAACALAISAGMIWAAYLAGTASLAAAGRIRGLRSDRRLDDGWTALRVGKSEDAAGSAAEILRGRPDDFTRARALELSAWSRLHHADAPGARQVLEALPASYRPSPLLRATLDLLERQEESKDAADLLAGLDPNLVSEMWLPMVKDWDAAAADGLVDRLVTDRTARVLPRDLLAALALHLFHRSAFAAAAAVTTRSFEAHRVDGDAYNAACSLARLGEAERALGWLERAVAAGYRDLPHLLADPDLAAVRDLPGFRALAEKLETAAT